MIDSRFKIDVRCGNKDPKSGKITWVTPKEHNLINNSGLGMLATNWATKCTENVYLETGGQINARYSGATLVEQTGTAITSDNPFFLNDASDATFNRLLVYDDGTQTFITGYNDVDDVDAGTSIAVIAQPATIYYVEEELMDEFAKASTTYDTGVGSNTNTWNVAAEVLTIENKRTIEFPVEAATVTYKGVGWTPNAGDDAAIFGRKVVDIPVTIGTQPVIEVTMTRTIDVADAAFTNIFTGLSVNGTHINTMGSTSYQAVDYWSSINTTTGVTVAPTVTSTFLECKVDEDIIVAIGDYAAALNLTNIDITGSAYATKTVTPTHTPGFFYADYIATFTRNDLETAALRTIALLSADDDTEAFWRYLFDSNVDFTSKRFNNLTIRKSWSRSY